MESIENVISLKIKRKKSRNSDLVSGLAEFILQRYEDECRRGSTSMIRVRAFSIVLSTSIMALLSVKEKYVADRISEVNGSISDDWRSFYKVMEPLKIYLLSKIKE